MRINFITEAQFLLTRISGFFLVSRKYCHKKWWRRGEC